VNNPIDALPLLLATFSLAFLLLPGGPVPYGIAGILAAVSLSIGVRLLRSASRERPIGLVRAGVLAALVLILVCMLLALADAIS
jgi:hypothetical protein